MGTITNPVYGLICDRCESKCKRNNHLKRHIENRHSETKWSPVIYVESNIATKIR